MATHSSVLAQRIPWIEETGCLQSLRCKDLDMTGWLTLSYVLVFSSVIRICTKPGLSRWLSGKESTCQCRRQVDKCSIPGLGRSPGKEMATYSSILGIFKFHGQRNLADCNPWGHKESDTIEHTCAHTHTVQHSISCKGTYFVLIGQLPFHLSPKVFTSMFRGLVTYHLTTSVHDHQEHWVWLGFKLWPRRHI